MNDPSIRERAIEYARLCGIGLELKTPLGHGTDGYVWRSNRKTAVKALERQHNYAIELECYQRFKSHGITKIHGLSVPRLVGFSDTLWIIEIGIVTAPYILDFAKSWLDGPADYTPEMLDDWDQEGRDRFDNRWLDVRAVLASLKQYGIYYYDAKPANIRFDDDE
jgi:hypothetical protein